MELYKSISEIKNKNGVDLLENDSEYVKLLNMQDYFHLINTIQIHNYRKNAGLCTDYPFTVESKLSSAAAFNSLLSLLAKGSYLYGYNPYGYLPDSKLTRFDRVIYLLLDSNCVLELTLIDEYPYVYREDLDKHTYTLEGASYRTQSDIILYHKGMSNGNHFYLIKEKLPSISYFDFVSHTDFSNMSLYPLKDFIGISSADDIVAKIRDKYGFTSIATRARKEK